MDNEALYKLVQENNRLIKKNIELSNTNQKNIKSIRNAMRGSTIARILYGLVVLGLLSYGYYAVKPYVDQAITSYQNLHDKLDRTSEVVNDPSQLINAENINASDFLQNVFGKKQTSE